MAFPFDPAAPDFSLTNALGCGLAAQLAYADAGAVDSTAKNDWGFDRITHFASPPGAKYDTQAFLAVKSDLVLVAFRGTEPKNIKDWLTDADIILMDTEIGRVHKGFWNALNSIWPALLGEIRPKQNNQNRSLWVTGHSLGACLSTLAVTRCHDVI